LSRSALARLDLWRLTSVVIKISYAGYRFPPVIIQQAIWLYARFTLSFRDVEDLLAERGIAVSYETVRRWVNHFGPRPTAYARYIVLHTYMEEDRDMLLVTFHGEPSGAVARTGTGTGTGINDVYAYDTKTKQIHSTQALAKASANMLSKLRSMVVANGYLYVTSGAKKTSTVLCYQRISSAPSAHKSASDPLFAFVSTVIGPTIADRQFTTSIAHPFGTNQDTNVVAKVTLTGNGQTGSLGSGSQSAYLSKLFPAPSTFLDGTFVASQQGAVPDVAVVATSASSEAICEALAPDR
jgi:hypothetical protein